MEAIPMAGETGAIRLDVDAALLGGAYATFMQPTGGIPQATSRHVTPPQHGHGSSGARQGAGPQQQQVPEQQPARAPSA